MRVNNPPLIATFTAIVVGAITPPVAHEALERSFPINPSDQLVRPMPEKCSKEFGSRALESVLSNSVCSGNSINNQAKFTEADNDKAELLTVLSFGGGLIAAAGALSLTTSWVRRVELRDSNGNENQHSGL